MADKVWEVMNDLEMVTSKICSAREILDSAIDAIQEHQYDKTEVLINAAHEFLEYYLKEFDSKFKDAWKETVLAPKQKASNYEDWEKYYYPEEFNENKVKRWILPIEDLGSKDYFINLPDDLLEQVGWKEGDQLSWTTNSDGTFTLIKQTKPLQMDEC